MPRPKQNGALPTAIGERKPGPQKRTVAFDSNATLSSADAGFELLFSSNPLPMYVCDLQSLQFLEVNAAAVQSYGYSRDEFLRMRITDIRPPEDIPRLLKSIESQRDSLAGRGEWRHRRKN